MMDHIRQRDWNSTKNLYDQFVDERDIDNCVVERIIRNKFWDPMISSDEEGPPGPIDWDSIIGTKNSRENRFHRFVPGFHRMPLHPKLSALTQKQHLSCIKVLSAENTHILPNEFIGKPSNGDYRIYEEIKELYAKEQEEYIEWAKHFWMTTNCIRALRPKPLVETVYEAEFKMKSQMVQCFPKMYKLAAQIPLKSENYTCDIILPKSDLIKVDISTLPNVSYPKLYENKQSIIHKCPLPEPCSQHPCKFILPNETEVSLLPLTVIHKELAQYALENCAEFVASEGGVRCLLESERSWSLPLSVCEVIGPDGDKTNILVLGSEFPEKRDPAPLRCYRAFRHLMYRAFTSEISRMRILNERSPQRSVRPQNTKPKRGPPRNYTEAEPCAGARRGAAAGRDADDSDDDDRLEIVLDDDSQNNLEIDDENENNMTIDKNYTNEPNSLDNQPRKILRACTRLSGDKNNQAKNVEENMASQEFDHLNSQESERCDSQKLNNQESQDTTTKSDSKKSDINSQVPSHGEGQESSKMDLESSQTVTESSKVGDQSENQMDIGNAAARPNIQDDLFEIGLFDCVCKDTEFEIPPPRSYKNLRVKNNTTKDHFNVIVHSSHKLKNGSSCEVLLEPIVEYQLDIGATQLSPQRIQSLAFSLMLRKNAELCTVRVDGVCGDVVTVDSTNLRQLSSQHGAFKADIANTLYTALNQLAGLRPGQYILKHELEHGANALLYAPAPAPGPDAAPLQALEAALSPAEEARLVQTPPRLRPVFLPIHKHFRQLPLAFTYKTALVARNNVKNSSKKKTPPAAIEWPKKRGRKGGKKEYSG